MKKKFDKNKFKKKSKSSSLSKINPYYDNRDNYLPYKYKDPSFKTKYNGPLMKKDLYLLNLMNNRLKKVESYEKLDKNELPMIQSSPIEVSKKKDLVLNSSEIEKQQFKKEYSKYIFYKLKNKFFNFNPITSRNDMIKYRKNKFRGIPMYKEKIRYNPKTFLVNFQNQNNYKNWEKIKEEYEKKELSAPIKNDKFYDENKIWEILNINKRNDKNFDSYIYYTEGDRHNKKISKSMSEKKRILIFKSESRDGKKFFSPIKMKDNGKLRNKK